MSAPPGMLCMESPRYCPRLFVLRRTWYIPSHHSQRRCRWCTPCRASMNWSRCRPGPQCKSYSCWIRWRRTDRLHRLRTQQRWCRQLLVQRTLQSTVDMAPPDWPLHTTQPCTQYTASMGQSRRPRCPQCRACTRRPWRSAHTFPEGMWSRCPHGPEQRRSPLGTACTAWQDPSPRR